MEHLYVMLNKNYQIHVFVFIRLAVPWPLHVNKWTPGTTLVRVQGTYKYKIYLKKAIMVDWLITFVIWQKNYFITCRNEDQSSFLWISCLGVAIFVKGEENWQFGRKPEALTAIAMFSRTFKLVGRCSSNVRGDMFVQRSSRRICCCPAVPQQRWRQCALMVDEVHATKTRWCSQLQIYCSLRLRYEPRCYSRSCKARMPMRVRATFMPAPEARALPWLRQGWLSGVRRCIHLTLLLLQANTLRVSV